MTTQTMTWKAKTITKTDRKADRDICDECGCVVKAGQHMLTAKGGYRVCGAVCADRFDR